MMALGFFAAAGQLAIINETMSSTLNQKIPKNVQPSVQEQKLRRSLVMQQDNCPKYTKNSTSELLKRKIMKVLEGSSECPDLNWIERMWHGLFGCSYGNNSANQSRPKLPHNLRDSLPVFVNAGLQLLP